MRVVHGGYTWRGAHDRRPIGDLLGRWTAAGGARFVVVEQWIAPRVVLAMCEQALRAVLAAAGPARRLTVCLARLHARVDAFGRLVAPRLGKHRAKLQGIRACVYVSSAVPVHKRATGAVGPRSRGCVFCARDCVRARCVCDRTRLRTAWHAQTLAHLCTCGLRRLVAPRVDHLLSARHDMALPTLDDPVGGDELALREPECAPKRSAVRVRGAPHRVLACQCARAATVLARAQSCIRRSGKRERGHVLIVGTGPIAGM